MGEVLKKFGRYFLLDHIAQGGMAEIYRARLASIDGAGRLLVIKKVQAGFGANTEFLQMFKSEIKVTMGFNHPNIVQLYDFGEENSQPYIAMEFVDGKNLRQFMVRFNEIKQGFPVELACHIIEQSACGLHYAHSFKDKISGQPLNIVHRDVSPQNVLISYEGQIKVIDFGIAKATVNMESTRAGVIKGKPSYLSPEQISGDVLDGRSDVFSLGIVFWELLCGKKLFPGENDLAVLKLIESCQTHVKPPSMINPKVPTELDFIVLKSLAKQREKRFQTAEEFQRAIRKFMVGYRPDFDPSEISYYAKDLFKDEIVEDRKRIQKLNDRVEQLLHSAGGVSKMPVFGVNNDSDIPDEDIPPEDTTVVEKKKAIANKGNAPGYEGNGSSVAMPPPGPIPSLAKKNGISLELDPTPIRLKYKNNNKERMESNQTSASSGNKQVRDRYIPKNNIQKTAGKGNATGLLLAAAALVIVVVIGPDYGINIPVISPFVENLIHPHIDGGGDITITRTIPPPQPSRVPASIPALSLRLNINPAGPGTAVIVNNQRIDPANPVVSVALDTPLEVSVERPGFRSFKSEFFLDSKTYGGRPEAVKDITLDPLRFGVLTIHTTPDATASFIVDGKAWQKKTPFDNEKIPAGSYVIKLRNEFLGMEKTVNVTVEDNKIATVDERLSIKGN
jgi:serine/threonine-protein kinase